MAYGISLNDVVCIYLLRTGIQLTSFTMSLLTQMQYMHIVQVCTSVFPKLFYKFKVMIYIGSVWYGHVAWHVHCSITYLLLRHQMVRLIWRTVRKPTRNTYFSLLRLFLASVFKWLLPSYLLTFCYAWHALRIIVSFLYVGIWLVRVHSSSEHCTLPAAILCWLSFYG